MWNFKRVKNIEDHIVWKTTIRKNVKICNAGSWQYFDKNK